LSEFVSVERKGAVGIIRLTRPRVINALNREMIDETAKALSDWANDDAVKLVLLEGEGERGFCSGGDVRAMRAHMLEGRESDADAFFEHEYALNGQIAGYQKPIVSLMHGITMGGGIGLAGHAGLRVATETTRFGMPETAIGFFPDVGAFALMAGGDHTVARAHCFHGLPIGAGDGVRLNLADLVVEDARLGDVRDMVVEMAGAELSQIETAVKDAFAVEAKTPFADFVHHHGSAFSMKSPADIFAALSEHADEASEYLGVIAKRCPTSIMAADLGLKAAFSDGDVDHVLARDLKLAKYLARRSDFAEGVRAVLVDKDHNPKWEPDTLDQVDLNGLSNCLISTYS
jgi:enoyl-CoA hydratase